jgi:serine protease AprX
VAKKKARTTKKSRATKRGIARAPARRTTKIPKELKEISDQTWSDVIFKTFGHQRFTQDSPIMPDVWLAYAKADRDVPIDIILTPHAGHAPGQIALLLEERLTHFNAADAGSDKIREKALIAYSRSSVVAKVTFAELLKVVIPMTSWWRGLPENYRTFAAVQSRLLNLKETQLEFKEFANTSAEWEYFRFIVLAGFIDKWRELPDPDYTAEILQKTTGNLYDVQEITRAFLKLLQSFKAIPPKIDGAAVWSISRNRLSQIALFGSRPAIKADAAQNVFKINTQGIVWAVIDCGIDAIHPAFLDRQKFGPPPNGGDIPIEQSRVTKTYDFTFLRTLLALEQDTFQTAGGRAFKLTEAQMQELKDLRRRVGLGREIDWEMLLPLIAVSHDANYEKPALDHGTHVGGILAGNWPATETRESGALIGICPDLTLYDFRVFDKNGSSEEFVMMAALQAVAHLNRFRKNPVIHGVNLSLSIRHEVMSYACGRTPICDECNRLVGDGVVVVAAAGNQGFNSSSDTGGGDFGSYRVASITDPGNADAVITVGATHRSEPHTYGVSYFSSRGPTGDGRKKPDLVAPGEKITAPIPNCGSKRMDGTSMAAPHVSGAAALLMARHRELIGRPALVKQVLCTTATDLGREASFQGAGMLDVLRALQSV